MKKIFSMAGLAAIVSGFGASSLAKEALPFDAPARVDIWGECTPIYAVQKDSCLVDNYYRCDDEILTASFEDGRHKLNLLWSSDGRFLKAWGGLDGETDWVEASISDGKNVFSMDQLVSSGTILLQDIVGNYDPSMAKPVSLFADGEASLTGESVTIDGVELRIAKRDVKSGLFLGPASRIKETLYLDIKNRTVLRGERAVLGRTIDLDFAHRPQKIMAAETMAEGPVTDAQFGCDMPVPRMRMTDHPPKDDL